MHENSKMALANDINQPYIKRKKCDMKIYRQLTKPQKWQIKF